MSLFWELAASGGMIDVAIALGIRRAMLVEDEPRGGEIGRKNRHARS